jgi:hypothetical protein
VLTDFAEAKLSGGRDAAFTSRKAKWLYILREHPQLMTSLARVSRNSSAEAVAEK